VRKRELKVLGKKLLDVGALDVVGLLELNNLENLFAVGQYTSLTRESAGNVRGSTGNGIDVWRPCLGT